MRLGERLRSLEPAGLMGLGYVLFLIVVAIVGPTIIGKDPGRISDQVLQPPSMLAPLGTDNLGRDQLARLVIGIRVSLLVGFLAAGMAVTAGITIGSLAGFLGNKTDIVLMRISETFQVMPMLIVAVAIVAIVGPGLFNIIGVIALLSWAQTARVMRSEVLRIRHLEYVDAVRCLGVREASILVGEVVPNALPAVMPLIALGIASAILQEASISFLGLGNPDTVSWGTLLYEGQRNILQAWWLTAFPGLAVFVTALAFNILGDAIGHALNPRRTARTGR